MIIQWKWDRFKGLDLIDRVPDELLKEYSLKNIQVLKNITDNTKLKEIKEKVINKFSVWNWMRNILREILSDIGKISVNLSFGS